MVRPKLFQQIFFNSFPHFNRVIPLILFTAGQTPCPLPLPRPLHCSHTPARAAALEPTRSPSSAAPTPRCRCDRTHIFFSVSAYHRLRCLIFCNHSLALRLQQS